MECPNCKHATSNTALLQCSHCGEAYERGPFEEYQHLEYLGTWLLNRSEISSSQRKELLESVGKKQAELLKTLLPQAVPEPPKPVEIKPTPAPIAKPIAKVAPAIKAEVTPLAKPATPTPASNP